MMVTSKEFKFRIFFFSLLPQTLALINIKNIEDELVVMVSSNPSVQSKAYRGGTELIYLLIKC